MIFLIPISFHFVSCAQKKSLTLWPADKIHRQAQCQARFTLDLKSGNEKVLTESAMDFSLKGNSSKLNFIIYTPMLTPYAKIVIDRKKVLWIDESSTRNLSSHPIFSKWFKKDWYNEVAFLFGIVSVSGAKNVKTDGSGNPTHYEKNSRRMECEYESDSKHPKLCRIQDVDIVASLDFSSVQCDPPL